MTDRADVLGALGTVYDPELDEPITALRFVSACAVSPRGNVDVRLRLPTPQCAPNFAYLMAADARQAVRRLPGVREVTVVLEDHYTGEEINTALASGGGFAEAFPGETEGDVGALRALFQRKALMARQARLCDALLARGTSAEEVVALRVDELPEEDPDARRCVVLRRELGIEAEAAFVTGDGAPLTAGDLPRWLRMGALVRTSLEANGGLCRSLLQARYAMEEVAA